MPSFLSTSLGGFLLLVVHKKTVESSSDVVARQHVCVHVCIHIHVCGVCVCVVCVPSDNMH